MPNGGSYTSLGERPHLDERPVYVPRARVERFIVPLLDRHIRAALAAHVRAMPGDVALDVGCGRQPFRNTLETIGFRYVSIDTQQNRDGTVEFIAAIDQPLPTALHDRSVALVFCTEVLEHVADWDAAFANFARLLRPGGRVLLTCPHCYVLHEEPYDFWRPTPHAIAFYAARHGLRVVHHAKLGDGFDVLGTQLNAFAPTARPGTVPGVSHLLASVIRLRREFMAWAFSWRWLRALVMDKSSLYLSNLAVLEKP